MLCSLLKVLKTYTILSSFYNIHGAVHMGPKQSAVAVSMSYDNHHVTIVNDKQYLHCFAPVSEHDIKNGRFFYKKNDDYVIYDKHTSIKSITSVSLNTLNALNNLNENDVKNVKQIATSTNMKNRSNVKHSIVKGKGKVVSRHPMKGKGKGKVVRRRHSRHVRHAKGKGKGKVVRKHSTPLKGKGKVVSTQVTGKVSTPLKAKVVSTPVKGKVSTPLKGKAEKVVKVVNVVSTGGQTGKVVIKAPNRAIAIVTKEKENVKEKENDKKEVKDDDDDDEDDHHHFIHSLIHNPVNHPDHHAIKHHISHLHKLRSKFKEWWNDEEDDDEDDKKRIRHLVNKARMIQKHISYRLKNI